MSRRQQVQPSGTRNLEKVARAYRAAESKLAAAMLEAHEAGSSLRTIAFASGYSHEKVRVVLAKERDRVAKVEERLSRPIAGLSIADTEQEEATRRRLAKSLPVSSSDR